MPPAASVGAQHDAEYLKGVVVTVAIATVCPGLVTLEYHQSVLGLRSDPRVGPIAALRSRANISEQRNELVRWFLSTDADHLWFLDADMQVDSDTLTALLAADVPIAMALTFGVNEGGSTFPVGKAYGEEGIRSLTMHDLYRDVVEVWAVGMGCTLVKREVLRELGVGIFWPFQETELHGQAVSEDVAFSRRAWTKGFTSYIVTGTVAGHVKSVVIE